ncbi:sacsin N-terminal ATP-binding-like domain-containing protein [Mucilaginibacter jinjuensis]|uniref:DUF3883 domain-containing protein n=1 Tax=Mucilaginibacter jinjuensis TaxID=1176721 RepID=A0ABY7T720_9SPHI|nr:DUF3883 domain-containing protein [Mucilaginibacter jinjuensis]WCT11032.1 DUF3883 domain-containing protein [Mucilaginibacter jinjuensis]
MDQDIEALFQNHYQYYATVGIETIKQQAGQVEQVSIDYQGRVIYELLQNSFDKALKQIKVLVKNGNLYIANDGTRFTYRENYNYQQGSDIRGDFQALCSISTSDKDVNTSIGNKGVGFKSAFSVSSHDYADIHTDGNIIGRDNVIIRRTLVSFRIYDTFKDADDIPDQLDMVTADKLREQIGKANLHNKDKGVPGYYYPILLKERDAVVSGLMDEGFVTVIQVPLSTGGITDMARFFRDISGINFHFIQLRVNNPITIHFETEGAENLTFQRGIQESEPGLLFHCPVNDNLKTLAQNAGINLRQPRVAVYFRTGLDKHGETGKLYNYLPTTISSPFHFVDLHADFHTSVDRTGINWDLKIGAYNKALLEACTELLCYAINSYLDSTHRQKLNYRYIDTRELATMANLDFKWFYLKSDGGLDTFRTVRRILDIGNNRYAIASTLLANIALKFFRSAPQGGKDAYTSFFNHVAGFTDNFARGYGGYRERTTEFKLQLAKDLVRLKAQVIPEGPEGPVSITDEIIFRDNRNDLAKVPPFIGVNLTSFEVPDEELKKGLGIKNFNDRNEILKYFRQVSPTGNFRDKKSAYTVDEQRLLLSSIASMMGRNTETIVSTHRYSGYVNSRGDNNSVADLANFALSTIFLRTTSKVYKPAQLCANDEIDLKFLPEMPEGVHVDTFLKYLGVSFNREYRFVDKPISDRLMKGLDYIPAISVRPGGKDDQLVYANIVRHARIIYRKKEVHPAVINNQYSFLTEMKTYEFKEEGIPLLVRNYDSFPKIYLDMLLAVCRKNMAVKKNDMVRFYQQVFRPFLKKLKICLVSERGELKFVNAGTPVFIVTSEDDYRLAIQRDIPVLCFYVSRIINPKDDNLNGTIIIFREGRLHVADPVDKTAYFRTLLEKRMFYLLKEISILRLTNLDYFESPELIVQLSAKLACTRFIEASCLKREIHSDYFEEPVPDVREFDADKTTVYMLRDLQKSGAAQAIAKGLLTSHQYAGAVELIIFHRSDSSLEVLYGKYRADYEVFQKKWITNYSDRFARFVRKIMSTAGISRPNNDPAWYRYNMQHRSQLLLAIYEKGDLGRLIQIIDGIKETFDNGVFFYFALDIDYNMYDERIARLKLIIDAHPGDVADSFAKRVKALIGKLGIDDPLDRLEGEMRVSYPGAFVNGSEGERLRETKEQVGIESAVERIFKSFPGTPERTQTLFHTGENTVVQVDIKMRKVIYQGKDLPGQGSEETGASGEVDVLLVMIRHLLLKTVLERKKALKKVYELILEKSKKDDATIKKKRDIYNNCLHCVDDDQALTKALIPFYYVTLHDKYAFADLFAWYDGRAMVIEVKSTTNARKGDFTLSGSEVNEAMGNNNYMIVRVTPEEMIFLGNPIFDIKEKLTKIEGTNFEIIPTAYNFKYFKTEP